MTNYVDVRTDLAFFGVKNFIVDPDKDSYVHTVAGQPVPEMGFATYRRNLGNIITVTQAAGAQLLIVTQALPRWHIEARDSSADQIESFGRIQNIQREVANQRGVPLFECAETIEKAIENELFAERDRQMAAKPGMSLGEAEAEARKLVGKKTRGGLFFSEVHPNDSGSDLIGKLVSDYLLASPLLAK
jgi:lysophospholipase L1-like esterase